MNNPTEMTQPIALEEQPPRCIRAKDCLVVPYLTPDWAMEAAKQLIHPSELSQQQLESIVPHNAAIIARHAPVPAVEGVREALFAVQHQLTMATERAKRAGEPFIAREYDTALEVITSLLSLPTSKREEGDSGEQRLPILDRNGDAMNVGETFLYQVGTIHEQRVTIMLRNGVEWLVFDKDTGSDSTVADFWYAKTDEPQSLKLPAIRTAMKSDKTGEGV